MESEDGEYNFRVSGIRIGALEETWKRGERRNGRDIKSSIEKPKSEKEG